MSESVKFTFKIPILGEPGVGKTSLVQRYVHNKFNQDYLMTIGVAPYSRNIMSPDGHRITLSLWDIAGQERFSTQRHLMFKGSKAAILVFDLTRPQSLANLENWHKEFMEVCPDASTIIFGNKNDLTDLRMIEKEEAEEFAKKIDAVSYLETSAKTSNNVAEAFDIIGHHIYNKNIKLGHV
ncbi:MAG: GTP-binding protein [Asgard group archaeon]|nr:GTP-binding protein [Asgard group archaeon]